MIYGMMRIKNEERWIARVLASMAFCEEIFVLDDHSTDSTVEICRSSPRVKLFPSRFEGIDETRDKNFLIAVLMANVAPGDWIVSIDGDEEIAPGDDEKIKALAGDGPFDSYRFQVLYLWDSPTQIRVDGIYSNFGRPSMFRFDPNCRFYSRNGGGFHCGNVPEPRRNIGVSDVKLLHYGYMHREDRLRKFEWYNAPDKRPIPVFEDGYRHMVVGDVFPADSRFMHAGPLHLRPL